MKILEYQSGGIYYTPFFRDSVTQQQAPASGSKSSSGDDDKDTLIKKEIINVLKENGLQNDVDYFLQKAKAFLQKSQSFGLMGGSSLDLSDLIRIQSLANRVKRNKELHTKAEQQIITEGSGSDAAISNRGYMYVIDKNNQLKQVTPETYYNNQKKYKALSNDELIRFREDNPDLAYNSSILTDLSNTVGWKSIMDYVKATIKDFGTLEGKQSTEQFTIKQANKIQQGLEQIIGGGPDGVYSITQTHHTKDQGYSDQESLNAALSYLYTTLPDNMKHTLTAAAASKGLDPTNSSNVISVLYNAIIEHTNHSNEFAVTAKYDASASKEAGLGETAKKEKLVKKTRAETIASAPIPMGPGSQMWTLNGSKDRSAIAAYALNVGKPEDDQGHRIAGWNTFIDVLGKDPIGHFVANESISFAGKALSEKEAGRIVYDGISDIYKVRLPYDKQELARSGKLVPDFNVTARFDEFNKWLKSGSGQLPQARKEKLLELGLNDLVLNEETGQYEFPESALTTFLVTNGYTSSQFVKSFDENSPWVSSVSRDEGKVFFPRWANVVNYGTEFPTKNQVKRDDVGYDSWLVGENRYLYKSIIAVPITDPWVATITTNNERVDEDIYKNFGYQVERLNESRYGF